MKSMFYTELEILEHEGTGPWLLEIKKKAFLEGAAAVLYDLAEIPQDIKGKNGKVSVDQVVKWAQQKIDAINNELNQLMAFELSHMLIKP